MALEQLDLLGIEMDRDGVGRKSDLVDGFPDPAVADLRGLLVEILVIEISEHQPSDEFIKVLGVDGLDRAVLEPVLDRLLTDVVPHEPFLFRLVLLGQRPMRRSRTHRESIAGAQLSLEQMRMCPAVKVLAILLGHQILRGVPCRLIDDGFVQTVVDLGVVTAGVCDLADVQHVGQDAVDVFLRERLAAADSPVLARPSFRRMTGFVEFIGHSDRGRQLDVSIEDRADQIRLLGDDEESLGFLTRLEPVPERGLTTDPVALLLGRREFVTDPLARDLPLELREAQQHVERQPAHRSRGIKLLRHRYKRNLLLIKDLHHSRKVAQRAAQPIDLVHDHHIDASPVDVIEQLLETRPFHRAARETAVVVLLFNQLPALVFLALDVIDARLSLGVE